jgi:iron complex outermembrane receptor protein
MAAPICALAERGYVMTVHGVFRRARAAVVLLVFGFVFIGGGAIASAQSSATVSGQVVNSVTLKPLKAAVVTIEELRRDARTNDEGRYTIDNIAAGKYHVLVVAPGFTPQRTEITVAAAPLTADVSINPEVHYTEVVSVSPDARNQFESYQPTAVLAGQELSKSLQGTLGATLDAQPGVAQRSFGPGPARPVIRGLDGDRIAVLENGQRMGDLSSQSGDHGVNVNPAAATRIEVVRGPATLLHGANAIGGLVNVISDDIPRAPIAGATGSFTFDAGTAASEGAGAGDVGWGNGKFAVRLGGSGRHTGDVKTPDGTIENTQSRSGFANIGLGWTSDRGYAGVSYGYDDTKYGIPIVEEGNIQLTPRRHSFNFRAEGREFNGPISSVRASVGVRRYKHEELEGAEVGTAFSNNTAEIELLLGHRQAGRLKGSFGVWGLTRSFEAVGEEALAPPIDQTGAAAFVFEEVIWPHATIQFGGRVDRASFTPTGGLPSRDFNNFSGSVGVVLHPRDAVSLAFSLARASRNPALEELYFDGPHPGNFQFEVGNPDLESEHGLGFDASLRWRHRRASGEVTFFRNRINDYIFRNPTGEEEDEFPVIVFTAADSVLQGFESHIDADLAPNFGIELGLDYVHGELVDSGDPLPRIPPLRGRIGARYHRNAFQLGGDIVSAAKQDRTFGAETATDGYTTLKLFGSYSFQTGRNTSTLTLRLDNATDELYRNHLSFIKDFVPEMGRNFKVVYAVRF